MKRLPVRWARAARLDLLEIVAYIREDRPRAAVKAGRFILRESSLLGRYPRRGKIVPELWEHGISDFRQTLVNPYRLVYRIAPDAVYIEAVIESRRDLSAVLFERLTR